METVLLVDGVTANLRVPAISRLQKIHNMNLSFHVLQAHNFVIAGNVDPRDIVAGNKDKTLSFLWQIVHQFQLPRLNKAADTIQRWYCHFSYIIRLSVYKQNFLVDFASLE